MSTNDWTDWKNVSLTPNGKKKKTSPSVKPFPLAKSRRTKEPKRQRTRANPFSVFPEANRETVNSEQCSIWECRFNRPAITDRPVRCVWWWQTIESFHQRRKNNSKREDSRKVSCSRFPSPPPFLFHRRDISGFTLSNRSEKPNRLDLCRRRHRRRHRH